MPSTTDSRAASAGPVKLRQSVGSWQLGKLIGQGQFADVFEARPEGGGDAPFSYALKVLQPKWEDHPLAVDMFATEARVAREVTNPHLLPILASQVASSPYFLAMPRLTGATLDARLKSGSRPGIGTTVWIARQVAEAITALHTAGWTHGDVKPGNIFISTEGHVTLIDLGFARRPGEQAADDEQAVLGTPHYLAPELLTSTHRGDIRSDLYSLGVVLFETLTGKRPFDGESLSELATAHQQQVPRKLRRELPQASAELEKLIESLLAKQPVRRPQSPADLVQRLISLEIDTFAQRLPLAG